jgi:hypothetical protein
MKKTTLSVKLFIVGLVSMVLSNDLDAQISTGGTTTNSGTNATASGFDSKAIGSYSVAIGKSNNANQTGSVAIGTQALSTNTGGISIGNLAITQGDYATSIGYKTFANDLLSMSLGHYLETQAPSSFAIGTGATPTNRLVNNFSNSLMVGFGSVKPTLFVTTATDPAATGEVRIGGLATNSQFNGLGKLQIIDQTSDWNAFIFNGGGNGKGLRIKGGFYNGSHSLLQVEANNSAGGSLDEANIRFSVLADGKVIIGDPETATISSASITQINRDDYRLIVQNGILAEKVKVALANSADWADYVFQDDFELKTLAEVESFIEENNHLPDVPSAEQVAKEGIDVAKMDALLLQKIEELTLYIIDLEKKIKVLEDQ